MKTAYFDIEGRIHQPKPEALVAILKALGAALDSPEGAEDAFRQERLSHWRALAEPVAVAWDGHLPGLTLRLAEREASEKLILHIGREGAELERREIDLGSLPALRRVAVESEPFVIKRLPSVSGLPSGYHRLELELGERRHQMLVIAAPATVYQPPEARRQWGMFVPLYAVHSRRSWGAGDLGDLDRLATWTRELGGEVVATLPLLAAWLAEPFEPSPYMPASRLFWNELFIDMDALPELDRCEAARALLASSEYEEALPALRSARRIDYRHQMRLKRRVLEPLSESFFSSDSDRLDLFERFLEAHPRVVDYAQFRAATERRGVPWPAWPGPQREGHLRRGDYDERAKRYHLYVQWLMHEQVGRLGRRCRDEGPALYLDMPLGVHPDGYDVWRERETFVQGVNGGAPPDDFFSLGQNWGFPPTHPRAIRRQGYAYTIDSIRTLMQPASILRIDHVMNLHRLYWIPQGMPATDGVYVRYPAEELYAILSLESHRNATMLIGEDLGTVPDAVRQTMDRRKMERMYVMQFSCRADSHAPIQPPPAGTLASLNTHDTPTYAGFLRGDDVGLRRRMGLIEEPQEHELRAAREHLRRALTVYFYHNGLMHGDATPQAMLGAALKWLASSPARLVLVNLEDLWAETEPQNVPGTHRERPNWRLRARAPLEEFEAQEWIAALLRDLGERRKAG